MSFGFPKFGFRFKRRRGRSLGGSDVQAPTWVSVSVIGDRLVGSFTYPDALSPTSRFELWSKLVGEADSAAVLVSAVAQTFDVPFNYVANAELLGGNRGFESGDLTDWETFPSVDTRFSIQQLVVNSGIYAAEYDLVGTATSILNHDYIAASPNTTYTFSIDIKVLENTDTNGTVSVYGDFKGDFGSASYFVGSTSAVGGWVTLTAAFDDPNAHFVRIHVSSLITGVRTLRFCIDNASIIGQSPTNITPLFALKAYDQADRPSYFSAWFQPAIISYTFFDPSNPLKQMTHSVSGLTAGTLRTATWPNKSGTVAMTSDILSGATRIALFSFEDSLLVAAGKLRLYNKTGSTLTISGVYLAANTAPTTNAIIVDINKNGTTIFTTQSNRPQIAAAANTGNTTTIDVSSLADGDYLTCDIDQVGITGATGLDLVVEVVMQ